MYARECGRSRVRVAEEVLPVLAAATDVARHCSDPIAIIYGDGSERSYSRRYSDKRSASPRKARRHPSPSAARLSRKYVAYQMDDLKLAAPTLAPSGQSQRTVYGTLAASATGKAGSPSQLGERPEEEEPLLVLTPASSTGADCSSNQSETESDSDTGSSNSTGSSVVAAVAGAANTSLQSILRIRSGDFSCRRVRKLASVEFAIDVASDEDEELAPLRRKKSSRACSSRCVPRRLTIEEKTALYRVRPDLELTPMPVLVLEQEEARRRQQRKLVFSVLGAVLLLLMVVVFYYTISQMDDA